MVGTWKGGTLTSISRLVAVPDESVKLNEMIELPETNGLNSRERRPVCKPTSNVWNSSELETLLMLKYSESRGSFSLTNCDRSMFKGVPS